MIAGVYGAYAQCGFRANQYSGCEGFPLDIQDTTTGAGNTANWTVTFPPGSNPLTVTTHNYYQFSHSTSAPGQITVTMTDTVNGHACTVTANNFYVYPNPQIHGHFTTTTTCTNNCIEWIDSSTAGQGCTITSFSMDWNNSAPLAPSGGICEVYGTGGQKNVSLILENSCGCPADTTFTHVISVTAPPSASFTGTNLTSCTSPFTSTMTATAAPNAKYFWYIVSPSGGAFPTTPAQSGASTVFSYSYTYGNYDVKLVVEDTTTGCSDSLTRTAYVTAGPNPAACFTANRTSGCAGYVTYCPCNIGANPASSYVWNFTGAGQQIENSPVCVPIYYYVPGSYSVQLIVYYAGACSDTLTKNNYVVLGQNYTLGLTTPDTVSCQLPDTVCVTYTGQSCPSCTFNWNPPNNTTPTSPTGTCYVFNSYGQASPSVSVTDTAGCQSYFIRSDYITVEPVNVSTTKTFANGNACANDTIIVSNAPSTGGPFTSVAWNFPGAHVISTNSTQASVTYPGTGCYGYTLIMKSQSGCTDTLRDTICIQPKPVVNVSVTPNDLCFEAMSNVFTITTTIPGDTPTTVKIWPEGQIYRGGTSFTVNKANFDSAVYLYANYGNFAFCYLANNGGCLGDTTCLTASIDSVHIYPPIASFNTIISCSSSDTVLFINTSNGADSIVWNFGGAVYPNLDTLKAVFPTCGINYGMSLTAFNDTFGCKLTKGDTLSRPCYEADFRFAATRGCYNSYCDSALIFFTGPNALHPSSVLWSAQLTGSPPSFTGYSGDTVTCYTLYSPGVYNACALLNYSSGCKDTLCKSNYIDISQPIASFTVANNDTAGCVPFCVQFNNTSTVVSGSIAKYYWTFGDTANVVDSVDASPSHCFEFTGQFLVCLTIVDANGCTNEYCRQVQADNIQASFTETDSITCLQNSSPLNPITYTNSSTGIVSTYQWLLPTALGPSLRTPGNVPSITEQYTAQGYDSIGLIVSDQYGICKDTVWKPIHVANPVANYSLSDTFFPCPPAEFCYVDSSQYDICSWRTYFGDGNYDSLPNGCHIITHPGTYCVTQVVTSCHGCVDSTTKNCIRIVGPTVSLTANSPGGCPCLPVQFYITSTGTDIIQFTSNSNGGPQGQPSFVNLHVAIGTATNPTIDTVNITYCNVGDVSPVILANNTDTSCTVRFVQFDSLIVTIPVDTPHVGFSYALEGCGTDSVCFTNQTFFIATTAHDSINYWTFGDGTSDTATSPCHKFPAPGNYLVTLQVYDQLLCSDSFAVLVHVPSAPMAAFAVNDSVGCSPFAVQFSDSSVVDDSTSIVSGYWNFGDGNTANYNTNTSHTYIVGGTDTAVLVITDGYGCTDSARHTIGIQGPLTDSIGANQVICIGDTATLFGSGSSTLRWLTDYNISDTNSATPKVWPQVDTCYILRIGAFSGCYVYDTVCINVSTITVTDDTATGVCLGQVTNFIVSAQTTFATVTGYSWTFGDGSAAAAGATATHVYAAYGSYTDSVIVTNSLGCKDTALRAVTILDIPHAAFTLSIDTVCPGTPITATNTSTPGASGALSVFTFNVPQPAGSNTSPDIFTPTAVGNETVTLIQTDVNQCADTVSQVVNVYALPASYNIDTTICTGATITLQAIGSNTVLWSPDYDISNVNAVSPAVTPGVDTTYIAQVGTIATCYIYDTVNVIHSVMTASGNSAPACLGLLNTYTATATAVNATINTYSWKFGDGATGTGQTTTHQYAAYGTYPDTLIVTSSRGCKDTAYSTVTVFDKPHAALSVSVDSVCLGGPVSVTNLSTAGVSAALTTFYFNVGFPPALTTSPATFTPVVPGEDNIIVVQTDANGCVDSATASVLVHNLPAANFNNGPACTDVANPFTSSSTQGDGPITTYSWFINGASVGGNSSSITDSFSTAGTVPVCLQVTDIFGCTDSLCQNITVFSVPPDTVSPLVTTICAGYSASFAITGLPAMGTVQWVPSTWVSNPTDTDVTITPLQTVQYLVYSYYLQCIPKVDTVTINVIDSVPVSASASPERIVLGLSSTVTPTIKGTIDSIVWSPDSTLNCGNCMSPVATPHETTTYTATIYYSQNGVVCSNTATVTVTVFTSCNSSLIYVPNTFTPNSDGTDDVFRLLGQGISVVDYFRVYDRWGKKVFEADNVDDASTAAWNGGYNNNMDKPENTGVFMYEFQIQCVTGQTVTGKGNVTLLR